MKFGNFSLANLATAEKAVAADTLYFPYHGAPYGWLGGPNSTQQPVAINSVPAFIQIYDLSNSYGLPSQWTPSYIWDVMPANAIVLVAQNGSYYQVTLYLPPAFVSWASLCYSQLSVTNYPSPGPVVPADSPQLQGVQYIAIMPDNRKPPSFANCTLSGNSIGPLTPAATLPLPGVTWSKSRGPKNGSYKLDG
jgi:hypothetical protein